MKKEITIVDIQNHFLKNKDFDFTYIIKNVENFLNNEKDSIEKINIVVDTMFEQENENEDYESIYLIEEYLISDKYEKQFDVINKIENQFGISIEEYEEDELKEYIEEEMGEEDIESYEYTEDEYKDMISNLNNYIELKQSLYSEAEDIYSDLEKYLSKQIPFELALLYYQLEDKHNINIDIEIEKAYNYYRTVLDYYNNGYDDSNKLEKLPYYLKMIKEIDDVKSQDFKVLLKKNSVFKKIVQQYKERTNSHESVEEILSSFEQMKEEIYESEAGNEAYNILNPDLEQIFIGGGANECLLEEAVCFCVNNDNIKINFETSCVYGEGDINSRFEDIAEVFQNINISNETKRKSHTLS